jgi:hypothetical protein
MEGVAGATTSPEAEMPPGPVLRFAPVELSATFGTPDEAGTEVAESSVDSCEGTHASAAEADSALMARQSAKSTT